MKHSKRFFPPVLIAAGAVLLMAVFALVPALSLWASERAALEQPHTRTAQAGAVSLTCDDIYIARMLKKLEQGRRDTSGAYQPAVTYPNSMDYRARGTVQAHDADQLIETAHSAGLLPDAWYESVCSAMVDGSYYTSTDSLGFMDYIVWSAREQDKGMYLIGLTVESQSNAIVGFWVSADVSENLPVPDTAAVLEAYTRYLGVEQANDWAVPVDTDYAENSIYSANAELLLSVQTGDYISYPHYELVGDGSEFSREYSRQYFCLNAKYMESAQIQEYQAYTRSFAGVPDMPIGAGPTGNVDWSMGGWGGWPAAAQDGCYELATSGIWIDAGSGESGRKRLILKTDYATRRQAPLCGVEGCPHADESCPAYVKENVLSALTCIGDKIYLLRGANSISAQEDNGRAQLWEVDPAAGNRRELYVFPLDCEVYADNFTCTDGSMLYGTIYDSGGAGSTGVRIDLATGAGTCFPLHGGRAGSPQVLGAAGTGLIVVFYQIPFDSALCPSAASIEPDRRTEDLYTLSNMRFIYYDTVSGLRRELAILPEMLNGSFTGGEALHDGKLYCTERVYREKDTMMDYRVWQVDLFTGELRMMEEFLDIGPRTSISVAGMLPAVREGQEPYLKISLTEEGNGRMKNTIYLLNMERAETLAFPSEQWEAYLPNTGPIAQTGDGDYMLITTGPLETTWDDTRQSYAIVSRAALLKGADEQEPIEMWTPEPALG